MINALKTLRTITLVLLAGSVAAVNGCDPWTPPQTLPAGPLRVVSLREPLSRLRPNEGFEHDLLWQFAQDHGREITWRFADNPTEAYQLLREHKADVLAGRWTAEILAGDLQISPSPAYEESPLVLVCPRDRRSLTENSVLAQWLLRDSGDDHDWIEDQALRIGLSAQDGSTDLLRELARVQPLWQSRVQPRSSLKLADQIAQRKLDCLVTDRHSANGLLERRSSLKIVRELRTRSSKVFLFPSSDARLVRAYTSWFQKKNRSGNLSQVRRRYFAPGQALNDMDRARFQKAIANDLPHLRPRFQHYAAQFKLPWQLLAAVAYQESHWDHEAESHTGVRGLMQLTRETARHLGVEDREDLEQSIWGGAKYLRALIDQQPKSLPLREKIALALAAYNVGWGHLRDAQKLAVARGASAFSFWDLRLFLPLLSDPAVAAELEFGTARGEEPVIFTERTLAFYDLLSE